LSHPSHWHLGPLVSRCSAGLFRVGLRPTKIFESDVIAPYMIMCWPRQDLSWQSWIP